MTPESKYLFFIIIIKFILTKLQLKTLKQSILTINNSTGREEGERRDNTTARQDYLDQNTRYILNN